MFELIPFDRRVHSVAAFDPFREFDELEPSFFGNRARSVRGFRTDVTDTGDAYKLEAELPGFNKDDIKIDIEDDCLTISAERSMENKEEDKQNFVKRERYYGSFSRSFDISGIDADAIEASYTDGVLTLTMPKKQEQLPASRRLEIK